MLNIEELDSHVIVFFENDFHVLPFIIDSGIVSIGLIFIFELEINATKFEKKLEALRSIPNGAKMDACEALNGLFVDKSRVVFGVFKVGGLEYVVKDLECIETTTEVSGHPEEAFFREFSVDGYV